MKKPYLCAVKRIFATFFLILLFGSSMHQLTLATLYVLNQDFISKTFCINKDKVEMQCNGKCHLSKSLAKSSEKADSQNRQVEIPSIFLVFLEDMQIAIPSIKTERVAFLVNIIPLKDNYIFSALDPPEEKA